MGEMRWLETRGHCCAPPEPRASPLGAVLSAWTLKISRCPFCTRSGCCRLRLYAAAGQPPAPGRQRRQAVLHRRHPRTGAVWVSARPAAAAAAALCGQALRLAAERAPVFGRSGPAELGVGADRRGTRGGVQARSKARYEWRTRAQSWAIQGAMQHTFPLRLLPSVGRSCLPPKLRAVPSSPCCLFFVVMLLGGACPLVMRGRSRRFTSAHLPCPKQAPQ